MKKIKVLIILLLCASAAFAQDDGGWTLQECVDYALENNLNVKRSLLDQENQEINLHQSKMSLLPDANANSSYGYSWGRSIDPTTNLFVDNQRITSANGSISSNVVLFNGFRLQKSVQQSFLAYKASQKNFESVKNDVIFNVITFYTNVLFTRELAENAVKQLNSTEQQVARTQKQVEAGAFPKSNLLDLLAQKATNELNLVNRENDYVMAKIQLKQALQLPPEAEITIADPEVDTDNIKPALDMTAIEVYNIALNAMPQVKGAELNTESTLVGVDVVRGNLYPTLSLSGGISTRYSDAARLPIAYGPVQMQDPNEPGSQVTLLNSVAFRDAANNVNIIYQEAQAPTTYETIDFSSQIDNNLSRFVSLNLRIPIFNGFSARAGVQRAVISHEQAKLNEKDVKYQLWRAIEQAYNDVVAAGKSYYAATKQVEAREESFRVTNQRFELGAVNFTDYQVAENDLFQAKSDLLRAKYDYIFKNKVLDFYQGKPLDF